MSTDLFADVPLAEQIAEAERELAMRLHVYDRRVGKGSMTRAKADRAIEVQRAIIATLRAAT